MLAWTLIRTNAGIYVGTRVGTLDGRTSVREHDRTNVRAHVRTRVEPYATKRCQNAHLENLELMPKQLSEQNVSAHARHGLSG